MLYDLFISYSRRDNERGQVATLAEEIKTAFHGFAGRDLQVFFDVREIHGMDDWRQKIQRSLRESQLFLAVLSPTYLVSPYCRWEWEDYVRYEAMRQCLGQGGTPCPTRWDYDVALERPSTAAVVLRSPGRASIFRPRSLHTRVLAPCKTSRATGPTPAITGGEPQCP